MKKIDCKRYAYILVGLYICLNIVSIAILVVWFSFTHPTITSQNYIVLDKNIEVIAVQYSNGDIVTWEKNK